MHPSGFPAYPGRASVDRQEQESPPVVMPIDTRCFGPRNCEMTAWTVDELATWLCGGSAARWMASEMVASDLATNAILMIAPCLARSASWWYWGGAQVALRQDAR